VFLKIKGAIFPFNGRDLFYAFFPEGFAAVGAVQDEGGGLAVCVVETLCILIGGNAAPAARASA